MASTGVGPATNSARSLQRRAASRSTRWWWWWSAWWLAAGILGLLVGGATSADAATDEERSFVRLTNAARGARGLPALDRASDLVAVARRHSDRMAEAGRIWHNARLAREVEDWFVLGENVGRGPSARSLQDAFMDSPPHRRNVLDARFGEVGVGAVWKEDVLYVTVLFVQREAGSSAPKRHRVPARVPPRATRSRVAAEPQSGAMLARLAESAAVSAFAGRRPDGRGGSVIPRAAHVQRAGRLHARLSRAAHGRSAPHAQGLPPRDPHRMSRPDGLRLRWRRQGKRGSSLSFFPIGVSQRSDPNGSVTRRRAGGFFSGLRASRST